MKNSQELHEDKIISCYSVQKTDSMQTFSSSTLLYIESTVDSGSLKF